MHSENLQPQEQDWHGITPTPHVCAEYCYGTFCLSISWLVCLVRGFSLLSVYKFFTEYVMCTYLFQSCDFFWITFVWCESTVNYLSCIWAPEFSTTICSISGYFLLDIRWHYLCPSNPVLSTLNCWALCPLFTCEAQILLRGKAVCSQSQGELQAGYFSHKSF